MRFTVKFEGTWGDAIRKPAQEVGIEAIDFIREKLQLPNLSTETIAKYTNSEYTNPEIEISEATARDSQHYLDRNTLIVKVNARQLNKYLIKDIEVERDDYDGGVTFATICYRINNAKIIEDWCEAGYPLEWKEEI